MNQVEAKVYPLVETRPVAELQSGTIGAGIGNTKNSRPKSVIRNWTGAIEHWS